MYSYICGIIKEIGSNYVTLDNNGIGYLIYTANPYYYNLDKDYTIYIYQNVKEDELTLYGFKSVDEKEMFLKLIDVKGLGPKMALPMFATGNVDDIKSAINSGNIDYLKKFPKIGDKVARQIVLDLKGKLVTNDEEIATNDVNYDEIKDALVSLGYKEKDIKRVIKNIDGTKTIEEQIKDALKLMLK